VVHSIFATTIYKREFFVASSDSVSQYRFHASSEKELSKISAILFFRDEVYLLSIFLDGYILFIRIGRNRGSAISDFLPYLSNIDIPSKVARSSSSLNIQRNDIFLFLFFFFFASHKVLPAFMFSYQVWA